MSQIMDQAMLVGAPVVLKGKANDKGFLIGFNKIAMIVIKNEEQ